MEEAARARRSALALERKLAEVQSALRSDRQGWASERSGLREQLRRAEAERAREQEDRIREQQQLATKTKLLEEQVGALGEDLHLERERFAELEAELKRVRSTASSDGATSGPPGDADQSLELELSQLQSEKGDLLVLLAAQELETVALAQALQRAGGSHAVAMARLEGVKAIDAASGGTITGALAEADLSGIGVTSEGSQPGGGHGVADRSFEQPTRRAPGSRSPPAEGFRGASPVAVQDAIRDASYG